MTRPGSSTEAAGAEPRADSRIKTAWRCPLCSMVSETRWYAGRHRDRREAGLNEWCYGDAEGPFYLLTTDEYLAAIAAGMDGESL